MILTISLESIVPVEVDYYYDIDEMINLLTPKISLLPKYTIFCLSSPSNDNNYRYEYSDHLISDGQKLYIQQNYYCTVLSKPIPEFDIQSTDLIFADPYPANLPFGFQWQHHNRIDEMIKNLTVYEIASVGYSTQIEYMNQKWNLLIVLCLGDFLCSSPYYEPENLMEELTEKDYLRCYPAIFFESYFPGHLLINKKPTVDLSKTVVVCLMDGGFMDGIKI